MPPPINQPVKSTDIKSTEPIKTSEPTKLGLGKVEPVKLSVTGLQLEKIEKVLRDGGMDSMSVIKSMVAIQNILESEIIEINSEGKVGLK